MAVFNIHAARTHFSKILERVLSGEEIIIAKAGKPIARIVPFTRYDTSPRQPGKDKGKLIIQPNFDRPLRELNR